MRAWGDAPRAPEWRAEPWLALLVLVVAVALAGALMELRDVREALGVAEWRVEILEAHSYADCRPYPHAVAWSGDPDTEIVHLVCPKETDR